MSLKGANPIKDTEFPISVTKTSLQGPSHNKDRDGIYCFSWWKSVSLIYTVKDCCTALSKEHRQLLWYIKFLPLVNSSRIIKPFKGSHGKISLIMQVVREMPEADVLKVAEKNQCLVKKVEKDSDENK